MSMRNLEVVKRDATRQCGYVSYLIDSIEGAVNKRALSALMLLIVAPLVMAQRPAPIQPSPRPPGGQQPLATSVDPRKDASTQAQQMRQQRNALRQRPLVEKTQ